MDKTTSPQMVNGKILLKKTLLLSKTQLHKIAKCFSNISWKDVIKNYAICKQN